MTLLDASKQSESVAIFRERLGRVVVGQEEALNAIADVYEADIAGLSPAPRPVGIFLFLGPTGTGKTRTVEAVAEALVGNGNAVVKIDCAEYSHSHQVAKLLGSPPGYLGSEIQPLITQDVLNRSHTDAVKLSFVLFDEIEKAHGALWDMLLGVLDKGVLTLGNNKRVQFARTMVFMTSNTGSREMQNVLAPRFGFHTSTENRNVMNSCKRAAKQCFSPEFLARIDKTVVFRPLTNDNLRAILDLEVESIQRRVFLTVMPFVLHINASAKDFLLKEGISAEYGARPLKRVLEREIVKPVAAMLTTKQIRKGDYVAVDYKNGKLVFSRR